jgi:hypothetical protein
VITSLTHSGKDIFIISLPVLLMLEEERMKRGTKGQSNNLMMAQNNAQTSHAPVFKGKSKKFKNKWKSLVEMLKKTKGACFKCDKMGRFKVNCPNNNGDKKHKEITMTITEVMKAKPTSNSW